MFKGMIVISKSKKKEKKTDILILFSLNLIRINQKNERALFHVASTYAVKFWLFIN